MSDLLILILPELVLVCVARALFLLGVSKKASARRMAAPLALAALAGVAIYLMATIGAGSGGPEADATNAVRGGHFAVYIKFIACAVGGLLVLLAWPTNADSTGSASIDFGHDVGEFFALMLLSIAGVCVVAGANDLILLFLGIELASIPTYIMVSMSRPLPMAQEAGVKYFFLGAMSAAVLLFGFSYLYGTTGTTVLYSGDPSHPGIANLLANTVFAASAPGSGAPTLTAYQELAVVMALVGLFFKIAAVPLHMYAGDVYQGAATPVTAFLSFIPKASGMVAIIKILSVVAVGSPEILKGTVASRGWMGPHYLLTLFWVVAALTMTFGNVLAVLQTNVKRALAYSSVAHSGYMLVGLTALLGASYAGLDHARRVEVETSALLAVLFYLAVYGVMNTGAFGVLTLLPSRAHRQFGPLVNTPPTPPPPTMTAETYDDLAGQGLRHVGLGVAMTICCLSLIGMPLTVGFFGKALLIKSAWSSGLNWLAIILVINAAISASYYLRIVASLFMRSEPTEVPGGTDAPAATEPIYRDGPVIASVALAAIGTLLLGIVLPATTQLTDVARAASSNMEPAFLAGMEMVHKPSAPVAEIHPAPHRVGRPHRGASR